MVSAYASATGEAFLNSPLYAREGVRIGDGARTKACSASSAACR